MKTSDLLMTALTMHGPPTSPDQSASLRMIERVANDMAQEEADRLKLAGIDQLGNDLQPSKRSQPKPEIYVLPSILQ